MDICKVMNVSIVSIHFGLAASGIHKMDICEAMTY